MIFVGGIVDDIFKNDPQMFCPTTSERLEAWRKTYWFTAATLAVAGGQKGSAAALGLMGGRALMWVATKLVDSVAPIVRPKCCSTQ